MGLFHGSRQKPLLGKPCNGCGYCCAVEPCGLAQEYLGAAETGACPALEVGTSPSGGTSCGMVERPYYYLAQRMGEATYAQYLASELQTMQERQLGDLFAQSLGVGRGCDASDDQDSIRWPWVVRLVPVPVLKDDHAQDRTP